MDVDGKGSNSSSKQTLRASVENGHKAGVAVDQVVGMGRNRYCWTSWSRGPGEVESTPADADRETWTVRWTPNAESSAAASVLHQRRQRKLGMPTARPSKRGEKASIASSTVGEGQRCSLNPVRAGTATTTSAETVEGGVAVPQHRRTRRPTAGCSPKTTLFTSGRRREKAPSLPQPRKVGVS